MADEAVIRSHVKEDVVLKLQKPEHLIKSPPDFTSPEELFNELLDSVRKYHPSDDVSGIRRAYEVAARCHGDQLRRSGEPYIIHPLCVAIILAELEMDKETIIAGLLHDVVEDTTMTMEGVADQFGREVALLVDGVTKLTKLSWDMDKVEVQAENLRKMFLAMAKDIRVILIKLADRLHNMRTLQYMRPEKQREKARETIEIYSPIANRLGISKIKVELDDLSLMYLEPDKYRELESLMNMGRDDRQHFVEDIINEVSWHMANAGISSHIEGRVKHFFSIYKKMLTQGKTLDQIYDLFAVRIIVNDVKDCYGALGVIHELYKPVPGRFKDYIAMPKPNMYQSLHNTLIAPNGRPFEIQIRTWEMHKTAEFGIAAHWKYKEVGSGQTSLEHEEQKMNWLRQVLDWQNDMTDNKEFLSVVKNDFDLFTESVYCFTPNGDVKTLPVGSTPIDFAYSIHSAVGNRMVGARVNGKLVPIDYAIQNGDRVEIMTSQNSKGPSRDWLKVVKSAQAKSKINQWFKSQLKEDNIVRGREAINAYCRSHGINWPDLSKAEYLERVQAKYGFKDWDSVLAAIGHGGLKEGQVINRLQDLYDRDHPKEITDEELLAQMADEGDVNSRHMVPKSQSGIVVKGLHDLAVRFSKCCSPVPGDEIVGFITRGRGISIHRTDCINMLNLPEFERARLIDAEWEKDEAGGKYSTEIKIYVNNRTGILVDISRIFTERSIDITSLYSRIGKNGVATIQMGFDISGVDELNYLVEKVRAVAGVIDIDRVAG